MCIAWLVGWVVVLRRREKICESSVVCSLFFFFGGGKGEREGVVMMGVGFVGSFIGGGEWGARSSVETNVVCRGVWRTAVGGERRRRGWRTGEEALFLLFWPL